LVVGTSSLDPANPATLKVEAQNDASVTVISAYANYNNYKQFNIKNKSNANSASSDICATADNGDETSNYINMGINGSGYAITTNNLASGSNSAYIFNTGHILALANSGNYPIIFGVGGFDSTHERLRIQDSGLIVTGSITSSLSGIGFYGTSSYSITSSNATTGTYAITSSYAQSSSYATTSSFLSDTGKIVLTADTSSGAVVFADVPSMNFSCSAGVYSIQFFGTWKSAALTTGIGIALNISPTSNNVVGMYETPYIATSSLVGYQNLNNSSSIITSAPTININLPIIGSWIISGSVASAVKLAFRSEVGSSLVTLVKDFTFMKYEKIK